MKTKIYLIVFLFMFCLGAMASPVGKERARQIATTFLNNNGARSSELSEVSADAGFDNVYVFTTESSFVLVAADDRVQPILGYSLDGKFDTENIPDNMRAWVEDYSDAIRYAINHQTRASDEVTRQWTNLEMGVDIHRAEVVVEPLIQTQWDQRSPYNMLCPSGTVTGCVATAMAQVMKYWNYPSHGIGSHEYAWNEQTLRADFGATYYDWSNMADTYSSSSTTIQRQAVATLMYHCGVSVNMNYGPSSGASTAKVADALKAYFNYSPALEHHYRSSYSQEEWINMLKEDLNLHHPIQYHGTGSGGGHSFVCDGYNSDNYFHFNWGWGGNCDAYYTINNLNPGPGGTGSGAYGIYNNSQGAIFGIQPSECAATPPTLLSYIQDGRQVSFYWEAAQGAVSYNLYHDNCLVGNTTETTYTCTAPYGIHSYYVRSVDTDNLLSHSSNANTITVDYGMPIITDLEPTVEDNNVNLAWTAPDWCYPIDASTILTYGNDTIKSIWSVPYYAHRYQATDLIPYANQNLYKIGIYVLCPGTYTVFVYTRSLNDNPNPNSLGTTAELTYAGTEGWLEIDLPQPVMVDGENDLWVVIKQETGQTYPVPSFNLDVFNENACLVGNSSTSLGYIHYLGGTEYKISWLIRTYLTDGAYTYNLYRNDESIANAIPDPHYTDSGLADGTYTYHLTTNYYGGETSPSNSVTVTVPGLVTQTVELGDTWTWWTPTVATTLAELETALSGNGILINSQDGGFVRYENDRWNGTLLDFEPGQMYRIKTQEASTITLTGAPVNQVSINILPGYNWFGYTGLANLTLANALDNFTPNENDQIIGQEGTATFSNGQWSGTLSSLEPGKGYIYYSTSSNTKTIRFE